MSIRSSFKNVGGTVGPIIVTSAGTVYGYRVPYLVAAVVTVALAAAVFLYGAARPASPDRGRRR